jgi:putative ABC transport system permease protein
MSGVGGPLLPFPWRLAWWMSRGQSGRVWLLVACIAIGVAARVCVGSFTGTFSRALAREARPLLGADLEVASNQPLSSAQRAELAAALPPGARSLDQLGFVTMALAPGSGRAGTVEVRAVAPGYPLVGRLAAAAREDGTGRIDPARLFAAPPCVFVQRELLAGLDVRIGGTLKLGTQEFAIAGVLVEDPGLGANPFTLGPRVLVDAARIAATGLTGPGARVRHVTMVATADPLQAEDAAARLRQAWQLPERSPTGFGGRAESPSGIALRTARQAQESVARIFDRLGDYLRLVSLVALLLGGIGVASLVRGFVRERLDAVATLQVLGASPARVVGVFLIQALGVGLAGGVAGAAAGSVVQNLLVALLRGNLPVEGGLGLDLGAIAWGMALSVIVTVAFAALPLVEIRSLRPLAVLRGDVPELRGRGAALLLGALGALLFTAIAAVESRSLVLGPLFIASLLAGGALTYGLGRLGLGALARLRPASFGLRHGLANLARAGFRPAAATVSIGLAALLFGTLAVYQGSLQRELDPGSRSDLPSLFAMDIQPDQCDGFRALLAGEFGIDRVAMAPMVRGRYRGRNGAAVEHGQEVTREGERDRFMRDREQNLSWREQPGADDTIIAGRWIDDRADTVEASLEKRFAESLGARLGDTLSFDVQGVPITATVTSLRAVRWASLRPNFFILLSPHAIRDAPQVWVASLPPLDAQRRARVQARLAERFPNVTAFDVSEAGARINAVIERIATAIRFIGLFCLGAGLVVLVGIGLSTARERRGDAALLKALGARNRVLAWSLAAEFGALGLVATVLGLAQALLLGWILVVQVLDLRLALPWTQLVLLGVGIVALSAGAGLLACREVFTAKPLAVLREG